VFLAGPAADLLHAEIRDGDPAVGVERGNQLLLRVEHQHHRRVPRHPGAHRPARQRRRRHLHQQHVRGQVGVVLR
jgi:hypothetical protein